jgi:hypothetical protein
VALRFVVGVLIGGIVVAGFLFILDVSGDEPAVVASPSSTTVVGAATIAATTTATTEAPWVRAGEARFESTVLLPVAMSVDAGVATLEYDLATLGNVRPDSDGEYGPLAALPERWLLVTDGNSVEGTPSVIGTAVRFEVSDTASLDDVVEVRLTRWRVAMPIYHVFEMPIVSGETTVLPGGASVTVRSVLEQKNGTIVRFDTQRPDDDFAGYPAEFSIDTVSGQGWRQDLWVESGFQLISENPEAPASVLFRFTRPMWMPVDGDIVVWEGDAP